MNRSEEGSRTTTRHRSKSVAASAEETVLAARFKERAQFSDIMERRRTDVNALLDDLRTSKLAHCQLHGSPCLPAVPPTAPADTLSDDLAAFSANLWSEKLPRGLAVARKRTAATYDADVLNYVREYAKLEEEYASKLLKLNGRLQREQADLGATGAQRPLAGGGGNGGGGLFGWGAALDSTQERPLAASVQYATSQRAWAALHAAVGENGRRHRAFAEELRATVIGSLKASVKQGYQRGQRYLTHLEKAEANVRRAREEAAVESAQYARVLRAFKKEHCDRPDGPRKLEASGPEMAVLSAAARRCVEAVREANKLTAEFEGTIAPPTLDTLQQHEEQRLQAIELALTNVAAAARTSAALPVDDLAALDDATRGVCVPTDIVSFSATYAGVGSTADELRPPPFAARISELYAAQGGDADGGFWSNLWRPMAAVASKLIKPEADSDLVLPVTPIASSTRTVSRTAAAAAAEMPSGDGAALLLPLGSGPAAGAKAAREDTELLSSVDAVIAASGGAGLTMKEAMELQVAVLNDEADSAEPPTPAKPAAAPEAAAPAAEAAEEWWAVGGSLGWDQRGPLGWSELQQLAKTGQLEASSWVFRTGMADWVAASTVDGLMPPKPKPAAPPPLLSESSSAVVAAVAAATPPPAEAVLASAAVSLFTPPGVPSFAARAPVIEAAPPDEEEEERGDVWHDANEDPIQDSSRRSSCDAKDDPTAGDSSRRSSHASADENAAPNPPSSSATPSASSA